MEQNPIRPFDNFQTAAMSVVKCLHDRYGFNLWMVTHTLVDDWIVLAAEDNGYNVTAGDVFTWSDSFCSRMVKDMGPRIAPDASKLDVYMKAPIAQKLDISAYIGVPISVADGSLFGTLCAIDPDPQPEKLKDELPFIELQARLLSSILTMEVRNKTTERYVQQIQSEMPTDIVTGLLNSRGWARAIHSEYERHVWSDCGAAAAIFEMNIKDPDLTDEQARLVATTLRTSFRPFDVLARLDEKTFGVIITELSESSAHLFNRAREDLERLGLPAIMSTARINNEQDLEKVIIEARHAINKA